MKSIIKVFLPLFLIGTVAYAADTASILPPAKTTFVDQNGKPLTSGKIDFYIPNTSTRKNTWQDAGETILNTNPVILDAAGRALILGFGSYRQVVKDRNDNVIWDQVTSSSGSGATPVISTGDGDLVGTIKPWAGLTAPNQYAFTYGQEISRTTYATLFTAITSTQAIFCNSGSPILNGLTDTTNFWLGMSVELSCVASGTTTVISKTASTVTLAVNANVTANVNAVFFPWGRGNGVTTFNLPDYRGIIPVGNNNMGGVQSATLSSVYFSATNPNSIGALGGAEATTLVAGNLPPYTPAGTITNGAITSTFTGVSGQTGLTGSGGAQAYAGGGFASTQITGTVASPQATSTFAGTATAGASVAFSRIPPARTVNYIIKIVPDTNATTASGVTSLGLMTGDIACGNSLTCTGNIISVSVNITPKIINTIRFSSQYGQADWCLNLIAALADLGSVPGTILIDGNQSNACTASATIDIGANHKIEFVSGSAYALNQTLQLGIGSSIIGTGGGPTYSGTTITGTTLRWTGAVSGDMVLFMNTLHGVVKNINIDCNLVSDCASIHYDSTNSNLTSQNTIENVSLVGGHYGLLVGLRGTTHPTTAQCNAVASQPGCYEMDLLTFRNFQIFGNCADLTAEGIHVNSYFALQQSTIGPGNIQCANIAIRSVFSAGPNTTISNVAAGSVIGVNPVGYQVDAGGGTGFNLSNFEVEGAWTYAVHDSGCSGSGTAPSTFSNNGFTAAVLLDGCGTYVSYSNIALSTIVAGGTTNVYTLGDVGTAWTTAGSGVIHSLTSSSLTVGTSTITSGTSHGVLTNNAGVLGNTAAGTNGQLFLGVTAGEANWGTMSGATSITNAGVVSLGSFTSANLSTALTNETGTGGVAVFNSAPNIITPVIQDFIDNTKQWQFNLLGITTGTVRTWAVPDFNDTFVGLTGTQTLTGKSIDASQLTGAIAAARMPALTGDVTSSVGTVATTLANIPTATPAVGTILHTNIAAPSSPAAGKVSVYSDSTDLRFHDKNASGTIGTTVVADTGTANNYISAISAAGAITKSRPTCSTLSDAGAGCSAAVPILPPQVRITLTSGTPVMGSSVTAATTVYVTPSGGGMIPIYDGSVTMTPTLFAEVSQTTADTTKSPAAVAASKIYDIFCWIDSGTNRCTRGPSWTNSTTRGYTLTSVNGILLNTSLITNGPAALRGTYIGTIASNAGSTIDYIFGGAASSGLAAVFNVWNAYNRVTVGTSVIDNSASYTYTTATIREAHGSTTMQVSFVVGLQQDAVIASYSNWVIAVAAANAVGRIGLGFDSTTVFTYRSSCFNFSAIISNSCALNTNGVWNVPIGTHVLSANEVGDGTNANNFSFDGASAFVGLNFNFPM